MRTHHKYDKENPGDGVWFGRLLHWGMHTVRIKGYVYTAMSFSVGMFCVKLERSCIKLCSLACYISIHFN